MWQEANGISGKSLFSEPPVVKPVASPSSLEDIGPLQHQSPIEIQNFVIRKKIVVVTNGNLGLVFQTEMTCCVAATPECYHSGLTS